MFRRIGLASSVMGQLTSVWRQSRLSLYTKLRLYNALVVSVLLYGAETWTLTKSDEQKIESFQMSCLRRILGIRWFDFVPNASVMSQTQQQSICNRIRNRRISIGYSVMYVVCKDQYQHMKHFVWLSTPVLVTDLMSDRSGNVHEIVPDILGSASWRSMSGLLRCLEGATTRRWSSGPVSEWVYIRLE